MIKCFTDLQVWQKAHQLTLIIYKLTSHFPAEEKYGLSSQIRRATVSVASNVAEGFQRSSSKVSSNFYDIADGSLEEVKYQLLLSKDLNYITLEEYNKSLELSEEVSKMLNSWSKTQR